MLNMRIQHKGGVLFEAETRGHRVLSDQPAGNGGTDQGMTPPELLLASLGTCAGYYAVEYLKARSLPAEGLNIQVSAEKATQPARLGSFLIDVSMPGLEQRHVEGLNRAVKACLIHNTLLHPPKIDTVVRSAALTIAA
ncbi:MAG TPA: OsmC family protein [Bryobacteraceae bacterium]|nr:OsmC family protein [Bryobacteraceae bacterium]